MQKRKAFLTMAIILSLSACAPVVLPPSGPHAAVTVDKVKIYQSRPARYERLGTVTHLVTSTTQWQENADATPAFTDLLAKAAAMGANGLLLVDDTNASTITAGAKFEGKYYLVPVIQQPKTVIVQAIYVVME